jgi:hypothetical protein
MSNPPRIAYAAVAVPYHAVVVTENQLDHMHSLIQEDGSRTTIDGRPIYIVRVVEIPQS